MNNRKKLKKLYKRFLYQYVKPLWYGKLKRLPWETKRFIFWLYQDHRCFYCTIPLGWKQYTVDHYIPKAKGGKNNFRNLRVCCDRCNRIKADKLPTEDLIDHLFNVRIRNP